jgi:predicted metal-dependent hydrolase
VSLLLLNFVLQYGSQDVHLSAAEQLVDRSQTRAVADAMKWLQARLKQQHPQQQQGGKTLRQWLEELEAAFDQQVRRMFNIASKHFACSTCACWEVGTDGL